MTAADKNRPRVKKRINVTKPLPVEPPGIWDGEVMWFPFADQNSFAINPTSYEHRHARCGGSREIRHRRYSVPACLKLGQPRRGLVGMRHRSETLRSKFSEKCKVVHSDFWESMLARIGARSRSWRLLRSDRLPGVFSSPPC